MLAGNWQLGGSWGGPGESWAGGVASTEVAPEAALRSPAWAGGARARGGRHWESASGLSSVRCPGEDVQQTTDRWVTLKVHFQFQLLHVKSWKVIILSLKKPENQGLSLRAHQRADREAHWDLERSGCVKSEVCLRGSEAKQAGNPSGDHREAGDRVHTSTGVRNSGR